MSKLKPMMSMTIGQLFHMDMGVSTDFMGDLYFIWNTNLSRYWDTDLAWDLARGLDWSRVALSVLLRMALGSTGVSRLSICFSLSFLVSMTMRQNLRVVTNNIRAVVDLCVGCVTLSGECFLTLLNVGGVNNSFTDWTGNLALCLDWLIVTLPVLLVLTLRSSGVFGLSLSLTLAISISTISNLSHNFGVMPNNSRAVVNLM